MIAPIAWTPEQQIARMLLLCEAQMESALSESDVAVDELIKSFKGLIEAGQALGAQNDNTNLAQQLDALRQQTAAAVVAWFAHVGALFGNAASNPLLTAFVPVETSPGFRLAVLWGTLPGGALI